MQGECLHGACMQNNGKKWWMPDFASAWQQLLGTPHTHRQTHTDTWIGLLATPAAAGSIMAV